MGSYRGNPNYNQSYNYPPVAHATGTPGEVEPDYLYDTGFHSREAVYECNALVLWGSPGSLSSSVGLGRFSTKVSNMIKFPTYIEGVLVGLILSDGWIQFASNENARLGFKQGFINSPYFCHASV